LFNPVFRDKFPYVYHEHLHLLDDEERKILTHFFGLGSTKSLRLEEIAELIRKPGLSTEQVRNRVSTAMGKLRDAHEKSELRKRAAAANR